MSNLPYKITYYPEIEAVGICWTGYATSLQFREGSELVLKTLIEKKARKSISDIRQMKTISSQDQKWVETEILPRTIKAGLKATAVIRPEAYFTKVIADSITSKVDEEVIKIAYFDDLEEAKEWLKGIE
jgi:hypothetical protein